MSRYSTDSARMVALTFGRPHREPMFNVSFRRVGGLWFWRIGRLGGSVYLAREA